MLHYQHLGRMEYLAALELQETLVAFKQREPSADILLFVEHPHVYTLGRAIIDLRSRLRRDVHRYVRNLELSAIRTLKEHGLEGARRPPFTGIWIEERKIAAIGVAVRRSITFHGLALNVNTDLSYFNRIIPCGLSWADVTSMTRELGTNQNLAEVRERFLHHFAEVFGYADVKENDFAEDGGWRMEDRDTRSSIIDPRPA